jgi:hypothetical protein
MQSAFFDVQQTDAAMRWHASRRTAMSSPLMFDVFSNGEGVAVCVLPGTEVAFETEVECEHVFKVFRSQKLISEKAARFRHQTIDILISDIEFRPPRNAH